MSQLSRWVVVGISAGSVLLLTSCGTNAATSPTGKTICSRQGGWCLILRRTATSAMVTVTCPVRSCSEATIALKYARPGQAYPGPEVREGLPEVAPGLHVDVAPTQTGVTCNAAFQVALGGWCMTPGQNTHYKTRAGRKDTTVATPTIACSGTCRGGWEVEVTGTAPAGPWTLTLPLPSVRAPREVAA